jgi:hypothetical protein
LTHPLETRKTSTITFKCGTTISSLLPIHNVCMRQPPLRIVAFFIGICHETLEMADELGRLALHYAVRFGASHEVCIMRLVILKIYGFDHNFANSVQNIPICIIGGKISASCSTQSSVYEDCRWKLANSFGMFVL